MRKNISVLETTQHKLPMDLIHRLCKTDMINVNDIQLLNTSESFKVPLRVQHFFCFWKLFVALNNCANFFCVLTNLNGFIGLRSCRFRAVSAISSVHDR